MTKTTATPPSSPTDPRVVTAPTQVARVAFHGTYLHTVLVDGEPHVVLKPTVEGMGLDWEPQRKKLARRSWAITSQREAVAADGKTRQMDTCGLDTWSMLLANIDENRVNEDARPLVIAYQKESAQALRDYWTQGGAINPRATEDQLDTIIGRAKQQAEVLNILSGIVDPAWLDAKARHVAARALGEEPEIDLTRRPLTVGEYLEDKGVTGEALRSLSTTFGKR
ncbi:MAG: phage antirepressor N-terminal domain-containing protein, partial [Actinomycetota bacterium]|nr:phage antirepressor N-terminal domain-containing protein [Actinomycetota bacterium]